MRTLATHWMPIWNTFGKAQQQALALIAPQSATAIMSGRFDIEQDLLRHFVSTMLNFPCDALTVALVLNRTPFLNRDSRVQRWQRLIDHELLTHKDGVYQITDKGTHIMEQYLALACTEHLQLSSLSDEQMLHLHVYLTRIVETALQDMDSPKAGLLARQQSYFRYERFDNNWINRLQDPFLDLVAFRNDCSHRRWQSTELTDLEGEILGYIASGYRTCVADFDPSGFMGHTNKTYATVVERLKLYHLIEDDPNSENHFIVTQSGKALVKTTDEQDHTWFLSVWSMLASDEEAHLYQALAKLQTAMLSSNPAQEET